MRQKIPAMYGQRTTNTVHSTLQVQGIRGAVNRMQRHSDTPQLASCLNTQRPISSQASGQLRYVGRPPISTTVATLMQTAANIVPSRPRLPVVVGSQPRQARPRPILSSTHLTPRAPNIGGINSTPRTPNFSGINSTPRTPNIGGINSTPRTTSVGGINSTTRTTNIGGTHRTNNTSNDHSATDTSVRNARQLTMTNCGELRFGHTQLSPYPIYNKRHNYIPSSRARRPRYTPAKVYQKCCCC